MGGKAKSVYLTVSPKGKLNRVFHKVFFDASAYNEFVKGEEFKAKYPPEQFDYIKETY
jgi:hypothetical protein